MHAVKFIPAALAFAAALSSAASAQLIVKDVDVDGVARQYLLYLPAGYDGTVDLPVLLNYHGGSGTMFGHLALTDMRPLADAEGFLLVHPQGLPDKEGFTIWDSIGPFSIGTDEIGYAEAMIDSLDAEYAVDLDRVYACGYSNGANMVWELGCFLSDRIAAVGAVAGSMWTWTETLCTPTRPFPLVSIHGTFDFYNPWSGGPPFSLGLIEASEYWVQNANGNLTPTIVDVPDTAPFDGSTVDHHTWSGGDECVDIEHYKVVGGGHDWPGVFGNMDIDSNTVIWEFVSQYSLNGKLDCDLCSITPLGVGVGGANIGTLGSTSTPSVGSTLQLDYSDFNGSGAGFLLVSLQSFTAPLLGGTIYTDISDPVVILPATTDSGGAGSLSIPLSTNPVLATLTAYAQVAMADGSQVAGWAFSNGLEIAFCN
ncbi:MAG: PHB depolymerase family esterase [Planctomycetota bacterium]